MPASSSNLTEASSMAAPLSGPGEHQALPRQGAFPGVILPFRRRAIRQPSDRDLDQAVQHAVALLTSGRVDDAERRFTELAGVARTWRMADRSADWQLSAWVGSVVCHALRNEWLSAEMAACEHLSEMPVEDLATAYIDAIALANQWLVNTPEVRPDIHEVVGPVERRRFPRNATMPADHGSDPARDYSYALVSALRFRLGSD
jgi:hypothetical protein